MNNGVHVTLRIRHDQNSELLRLAEQIGRPNNRSASIRWLIDQSDVPKRNDKKIVEDAPAKAGSSTI